MPRKVKWTPPPKRTHAEAAAHRAEILSITASHLSIDDLVRMTGRRRDLITTDISRLKQLGHAVPHCPRPPSPDACIAVYRHFNADGQLLYIGCSTDPMGRTKAHASSAPWFREVARIELQHFDSLSDALAAEAEAIRMERPLHNVKCKLKVPIE